MRRGTSSRVQLAFLLTVLFVGATAPCPAADWKSLTPTAYADRARVFVDGKERTYYRFTADEPVTFSVEGPTRIKVLTRARIPNPDDSASYGVVVTRDGAVVETREFESRPKESAFYVAFTDFRPGVIRRLYIDGYELTSTGSHHVDARVFASTAERPSRVSIAPSEYGSVETLLYRDKELAYYVMTKDDLVTLDVVGPTTIKVNTRLLYDATMLGDQTYVVGVAESGSDERLYRIDAEPSETIVCRDRGDVIPGALRHFSLEVGAGAHTYEFRLVDSLAGGLAVKFYIPRGDVPNEP